VECEHAANGAFVREGDVPPRQISFLARFEDGAHPAPFFLGSDEGVHLGDQRAEESKGLQKTGDIANGAELRAHRFRVFESCQRAGSQGRRDDWREGHVRHVAFEPAKQEERLLVSM
jgi:hypothetical protein